MNSTAASRNKRRYAGARAFFAVVFIVFIFTVWASVRGDHDLPAIVQESHLQRRTTEGPFLVQHKRRDLEVSGHDWVWSENADDETSEQCRLVHTAKDQCAFVRANCPDEEAGLFSYLQLYYCRLPKAKGFAFVLLVTWLGLLFSTLGIAASDFLCINLGTIASILGMSESMAGVTFLAFGNGSPDVFSTFAAIKTHSGSLAVGELIGAAGFITAVVAGSMAIVRPFKVARKSFFRDVGFFLVAACFSMVFLADGHLHLWECAVMVGFYIFYVITVFVWHWYLGQKRRRQEREYAARGHFLVPESDDTEFEPFHDDDEDRQAGGNRRPSRGVSAEDFAALERGNSPLLQAMKEDIDEQTRGHWMAEISSNMRVSRPPRGERRKTANPIRPSLVGALEFRAVLSSLEKSRNIQTIPLASRRYSDDPNYTTSQQQDRMSTASNPEISYDFVDAHNAAKDSLRLNTENLPTRVRAVSANDASGLRLDVNIFQPRESSRARSTERSPSTRGNVFGYFSTSPAPISRTAASSSANLLAPPAESTLAQSGSPHHASNRQLLLSSPLESPQLLSSPNIPHISLSRRSSGTQASSPCSPFPEYYDDAGYFSRSRSRAPSIRLPPPSIGSESTYNQRMTSDIAENPIGWWPYKALPPPQVLISTLFPTLYSWHDKNSWEKLLGIISAPSVFLLAITLPVVESQTDDEVPDTVDPDPGILGPDHARSRAHSVAVLPPNSPDATTNAETPRGVAPKLNADANGNHSLVSPSIQINDGPSNPSMPTEQAKVVALPIRQSSSHIAAPIEPGPKYSDASSAKEWNRWLVASQIFTAPLFIVLLVWANTDADLEPRNLLLPCLYSLIASLVAFALLVFLTSPSKAPRYRYLLCFFGFIVSVAWISTIANEVVGVLKAFGVILGISDAILGLTIFAVGNSLGDLVADITVARLGFPVMALSACFGGPMLNILLGIGLSGLYMTIRHGRHKHDKHPDRPIHYTPYQIEINPTLLISGATLVITLLGLLLVVPLNKWWMDRKVGWALVVLWTASTVGNVLVEVMGWGWDVS
ncbi:MAG: hypothetical protein Q9196_002407 [Gyalolechia fulgens]